MSEYKLIVTGSHSFEDADLMLKVLEELSEECSGKYTLSLVCGMAKGADQVAHAIFSHYGGKIYEMPADWSLGKKAGFLRNEQMGQIANGLLAFWMANLLGQGIWLRPCSGWESL